MSYFPPSFELYKIFTHINGNCTAIRFLEHVGGEKKATGSWWLYIANL